MNELYGALISLSLILICGIIVYVSISSLLKIVNHKRSDWIDQFHMIRLKRCLFLTFSMTLYLLLSPSFEHDAAYIDVIHHAAALILIFSIGWFFIVIMNVLENGLVEKFLKKQENIKKSKLKTRIRILRRVFEIVTFGITLAAALITFPSVRAFGVGIIGSAGLAGLVVGMAARPSISNLLAGVQLAFTQPVSLEDAVVIEGEWGWIEEINMTYVVVRIWDLRRLILPLSYLMEKPYQNWSKCSDEILGTVFLHLDYQTDVEKMRQKLHELLTQTELWDGKAWCLQVTDANDKTMEIRALMSAKDSPTAWNLRCHIREKLIEYLQKEHKESLPKLRASLATPPDLSPSSASKMFTTLS